MLRRAALVLMVLNFTPAEIDRALTLARWPTSDAERARFHQRYQFPMKGRTFEYYLVQRIEVITEFRRLVLTGEEHARMNDLFGRGGLRDVEEAMAPSRGKLSIVVHLTFDPTRYIVGVPDLKVAMDGSTMLLPLELTSSGITGGDPPVLIGARIETVFDAKSVGQETRHVLVYRERNEIARVAVEFAKLD